MYCVLVDFLIAVTVLWIRMIIYLGVFFFKGQSGKMFEDLFLTVYTCIKYTRYKLLKVLEKCPTIIHV